MVNVFGVPTQPLAVGVIVIVEVTGAVLVFVAVNVAISPLPFAARPILASEFVQANVVPATGPVKLIAVVVTPLHNVWSNILSTVGVGFTVIVNVFGVPTQPLAVGVIVIVDVTGAVPVFVAVNVAISPLPLAAKPMLASVFTQL